jgi:hypothetical protein
MKRVLLVAVLVVAGAGSVTGCGSVTGSLSANASSPDRTGTPTLPDVPGYPRKPFVRPGASAIWLPYPVINSPDPQDRLRTRLIRSRVTIDRITHMFNTLGVPAPGVRSCPMDNGSELFVVFRYPTARAERVVVRLSGCGGASNGRAGRVMTGRLENHLMHLVGAH